MHVKRDVTTYPTSKFIYTGNIQNVLKKGQHTNTPMFKDFESQKLFAIIQSPGCFMDIYTEAKAVKYQDIVLMATSLDVSFVSDIARLIAELSKVGKHVGIYFPHEIPSFFRNITVLENSYVHVNCISYTPARGNHIIASYRKSPMMGVYNIEFHDGTHNFVVCGYVDKESIEELAKDPKIDEIHLPYTNNHFGGLSFKEIMNTPRREIHSAVRQKIRINGFHNQYEIDEVMEKYPSKIVEVIDRL